MLPVGEPVADPGAPEPCRAALPLVPVLPPVAPVVCRSWELAAGRFGWSLALLLTWASGARRIAAIITTTASTMPNRPPHRMMLADFCCSLDEGLSGVI